MNQLNKGIRLFVISDSYKRIFSLLSLTSILVASVLLLTKIKDIPLTKPELIRVSWILYILFIVWGGGNLLNRNLHQSKNSNKISYLIALCVNGYLYFLVFYSANNVPKNWTGFISQFYYSVILLGVNAIWLLIMQFEERKVRPFFSRLLIMKSVINLLAIIIILILKWNLDTYWIGKAEYNYLDKINILNWFFGLILIISLIMTFTFAQLYLYSYNYEESRSSKQVYIWNSFIRIVSLAIWCFISFSNLHFNMYEIWYGAIAILFIGIIILSLFIRYKKHENDILIYSLTLSLVIMSYIAFATVIFLKGNSATILLEFILFVFAFQLAHMFTNPTTPNIYYLISSLTTYLLMVFTIMIWGESLIFGEGINIFSIDELSWGLICIITTCLLWSLILDSYFRIRKINSGLRKSIKIEKMKEVASE